MAVDVAIKRLLANAKVTSVVFYKSNRSYWLSIFEGKKENIYGSTELGALLERVLHMKRWSPREGHAR